MHVLTVVDHPKSGSFTHAVAERFSAGAQASGSSVEVADLHAEGFDPIFRVADHEQYETEVTPADVVKEQARIERCDVLCLAFPLFWYGMPAMTKGWIDRVWTYGWAYDQVGAAFPALLRDRVGVLLVPAGANPDGWKQDGLDAAMRQIWGPGTLACFGVRDLRIHFFGGSEGSEQRRGGILRDAFEIGASIGAADAPKPRPPM